MIKPRSLLIQGHGEARGGHIPAWVATSNSVENWAATLESDWMEARAVKGSHLVNYDLIIGNLHRQDLDRLLKLAEGRPNGQKWASLVEGDALDYLDPCHTLTSLLDASDLVITINSRTERYFQSITSAPCKNLGIPYPVDFLKSLATPVCERRPGVLVCPRSNRKPSIIVAEALGMPVHVYVKHLSRQLKNVPVMIRRQSTSRDLFAEVYQAQHPGHRAAAEQPQPTFWAQEGKSTLWVNLDPRFTWARFVIDAACLGMPIVTTLSTGHGERLFPQTTVPDVFCIDQAIAMGERLASDSAFYQEVVDHASKTVESYRPEVCKAELFSALGFSASR